MARNSTFLLCLLLIFLTGSHAIPASRRRGPQVVNFNQQAINIDSLEKELRQETQEHNELNSELVEALRNTFSVLRKAISYYNNSTARYEMNSACKLTSREAKEEPERAVNELVYHFEGLVAELEDEEVLENSEDLKDSVRELECIRHTFSGVSTRKQEPESKADISSLNNRVRGVVRKLENRLRSDRLKLNLLDGSMVYSNEKVGRQRVNKLIRSDSLSFPIQGLSSEDLSFTLDGVIGGVSQEVLEETTLDEYIGNVFNAWVVLEAAKAATSDLEDVIFSADASPDDSLWDQMISHGPACGYEIHQGQGQDVFHHAIDQINLAIDLVAESEENDISTATEHLSCVIEAHFSMMVTMAGMVTEDQLLEMGDSVQEVGVRLLNLINEHEVRLDESIQEFQAIFSADPTGIDYPEPEEPADDGKKTVVRVETEVMFNNQCCDYTG